MKTLSYLTAAAAMASAVTMAAHAQNAYEVRSMKTTETVNGVTTDVQTNYVSRTSLVPNGVIGDAPATPAATSGSVKVKLPTGEVINVPDAPDSPWNRNPRLSGFDRFTFDPVTGVFVAGKGEARFSNNWDDNGNRIPKSAQAPMKKVTKKAAVVEETTTTTAEPAAETPATDTEAPAAQ